MSLGVPKDTGYSRLIFGCLNWYVLAEVKETAQHYSQNRPPTTDDLVTASFDLIGGGMKS